MTRPPAPERPRPRSFERQPDQDRSRSTEQRRQLELARARQAERRARILAETQAVPPAGRWRTFVQQYGWRAYAVPVLAVVTVIALVSMNTHKAQPKQAGSSAAGAAVSNSPVTSPPTAALSGSLKGDTGGSAATEALASDALPAGAPYPQTGAGQYHSVLAGSSAVYGTAGPLYRFSIEAENGMTIDPAIVTAFANMVTNTLSDPHSWIASGKARLQRAAPGSAVDFEVTLTSSMTVRQLCGYDIKIETSCYAPTHGHRVVINAARWIRGDPAYLSDLRAYEQYMINHEVGHALGHAHAHQCLTGGLAPVMMQQTIGLKTEGGKVCQPNQWPYPTGAADAPGAEQAAASADAAFVTLNS